MSYNFSFQWSTKVQNLFLLYDKKKHQLVTSGAILQVLHLIAGHTKRYLYCKYYHCRNFDFRYIYIYIYIYSGVSGSGSATGELGHYSSHPRPQVADMGTPSRMDKRLKRVAPDKGAADKQCLRRRKTLIPNRGRWSSLSLFRQIHLGEGKLWFQTGADGPRLASLGKSI